MIWFSRDLSDFGIVRKLKVKKFFKYQSVRAEIVLKEEYKEKFERGGFVVRLAGGRCIKEIR
jgi:hypothetical protein